jgi:hypothetical protein
MSTNQQKNKPAADRPKGGIAAIATFDLVATTLDQLTNRRFGMDGIGCLFGPSGWGKTFSSNVLAIKPRLRPNAARLDEETFPAKDPGRNESGLGSQLQRP